MEYDTKCETVTDCNGVQQDETNGGGTSGGENSGGVLDFYGVPVPPSSVSTEYLLAHRKCPVFFLARCTGALSCGRIGLAPR